MTRPLSYSFCDPTQWVGGHGAHGVAALAGSLGATLAFARSSGARGGISTEPAGCERLAAQAPECFAALREAIASGAVEIVGGAYARPTALLHGGESNVRQLVLGVRAVRRLFGAWPRCAWDSSFSFFPQAPQMLAACGFESAALFPLWTARTPDVPLETAPLVIWEGLDGSRLPTLAFTAQCLQGSLAQLEEALELAQRAERPVLLHWLDALDGPSTERVRELLADAGGGAISLTPSELAAELVGVGGAPVRSYALDETFPGVTLGKNGDYMPRFSRTAEEQLLAAESLSALAGMFGRPYASRDVYPSDELEEAWSELCIGQHHHVHEWEGARGALGERCFERAVATASEVFQRTLEHMGQRVDALEGSTLVYNPLGWTRDVQHDHGVVSAVPAYGYRVVDPYDEIEEPRLGRISMELGEDELVLRRGEFEARIDRRRGVVTQLYSRDFPQGVLGKGRPLGQLEMKRQRSLERFETVHLSSESSENAEFAEFAFQREGRGGSRVRVVYSMSMLHDALWIRFQGENLARPDPGVGAALVTPISAAFRPARLVRDHPYGVSRTEADTTHFVRHPGADKLERVEGAFTAHSFVDLLEDGPDGRGLLVLHDGSQGFLRDAHGVRAVLNAYDPWDGEHFDNVFDGELWLAPHGALTNTDRVRLSMECNLGSPRFESSASVLGGGDLPPLLGALHLDAPNVLVTALHRENEAASEHVDNAFAKGVRDPFVVRLVEFDGRACEALLRLPGPIAKAAKTDLLGRTLVPLAPRAAAPPFGPDQLPWSALVVPMRPYEIATVRLDLEFGRQVAEAPDEVVAAAAAARRQRLSL